MSSEIEPLIVLSLPSVLLRSSLQGSRSGRRNGLLLRLVVDAAVVCSL